MAAELVTLGQQALMLVVLLSLPPLAVALLVGLVTAMLSTLTQIQDSSLSHLPRLVAVTVTLVALGPWMGEQIVAFASRAFTGG